MLDVYNMNARRFLFAFPKCSGCSSHLPTIFDNSKDGEFFFITYHCDDKQVFAEKSTGWVHCSKNYSEELKPLQDSPPLAEQLHEAADGIPFSGYPLIVVLEIDNLQVKEEAFIRLAGALRRLKDWHNADIKVVQTSPGSVLPPEPSPGVGEPMEIDQGPVSQDIGVLLQRYVGASIVSTYDEVCIPEDVIWRGKCALVDKTMNRGFILPGFQLQTRPGSSIYIPYPTNYNQDKEENAVPGRMIEVLDEVTIATIPNFMFTGVRYNFSMFSNHPQSEAFMEQILSETTGLMMRLVCYPSSIPVQTCGEKYLSTSSWKESVLANITYVQEPEEEYQDPHKFLQFLVTSDRKNPGKIIAHLLKSPSQINGGIAHCLHRQSLLPRKQSLISQEDIAAKLSQMPCLNAETLDWLSKTVEDIQSELLKEWLDEKKAYNVVVELEAVHKFLCEIQELVLKKLGPSFPTKYQMPAQPPEDVVFTTELDLNPSEWPERQYLLHQECQRKGLSRVQSTESLALSSPLQAEEAIPTIIDIKNFTKLFREDGSAASENLSPVRRRHPSRTTGSQISLSVRSDTTSLLWPECRDVRAPDVYYNRDKKSERVAAQCSKIQDRYVKEETYSSCSSPIFFVKKKENKGREVADINLRRSPRKALSKLTSPRTRGGLKRIEGKLKSPRKSAGGILKSPLKRMTTHLKSPRKSTGGILKSPLKRVASQLKSPRRSLGSFTQTHSHTTLAPPRGNHMKSPRKSQVTGNETGEVRRSPRKKVSANFASVLQSHGRRQSLPAPGKSTLDKPSSTRRLSSLGGADLGRKESRSERHKRKLEEIVTDVLVQHGIGKGDPLHAPCVQRLYKVTKLFVMDLPTSQNLKQEMRNIAEGQVKQVVDLEKKRLAK